MYLYNMGRNYFFLFAIIFFASCSVQKKIGRSADRFMLNDSSFVTAHTGISVYDAGTKKYLYNYQGDQFFVPASNTKIPTIFAAMKFLGDSIIAASIARSDDGAMLVFPAGDPTFLHPDYNNQPLYEKLKNEKNVRWDLSAWKTSHWGNGWAWNDYDATYMAERSPFPIYGNVLRFNLVNNTLNSFPIPVHIRSNDPDTTFIFNRETSTVKSNRFRLDRALDENEFYIRPSLSTFTNAYFPYRAHEGFVSALLKDTLNAENVSSFSVGGNFNLPKEIIYSQPLDSMLKPLMYRSDNFFAEQTLLMVSHKLFGVMDESLAIDTMMKTEFRDLQQEPRWADGSGLSRYNLFTPQNFIAILEKMKDQFGMDRLKNIFATGNTGTLRNYYVTDSTFIYAKTGTLGGVVALSGFLITKKDKLLIVSVLVNNHRASSTDIRRGVEKFVKQLRQKY